MPADPGTAEWLRERMKGVPWLGRDGLHGAVLYDDALAALEARESGGSPQAKEKTMPEQRAEQWRVVTHGGTPRLECLGPDAQFAATQRARILDSKEPWLAPHRVERRTVTVSEWETVE